MTNAKPATALVVGAGAVGCLYGCMLAQAGADVSLVCRSDYAAVKANGVRLDSVWGDFDFRPRQVVRNAAEYGAKPDLVLVALKVLPEIDAAALVRDAVGPETALLVIQNGVEIEPPLARAFPDNELISGLAFVCSSRTAPGCVHHLDYGRLTLGSYPSGVSPLVQLVQELLRSVGVPCETNADIVAARWHKLMWNAAFNTLAVLGGGLDTGQILADPAAANLARQLMSEVEDIARAAGSPMPAGAIDKYMADTLNMKPYKPSMLLDHEAGRPMEVEAILGNAVRAAQRCNVPAPRLECLYAILGAIDRENRARAAAPS